MSHDSKQHRVQLWFGEHLLKSFRAEPAAAQEYAAAMDQRFPGILVTVDEEPVHGLAHLPCEQLWTLTP